MRTKFEFSRRHASNLAKYELSERQVKLNKRNVSVAMRIGETPVPIPNTTVKTYPAEDTAWATVWESRWLPNLKKNNRFE